MTQYAIRTQDGLHVVYATEFGVDSHDLAAFKTPRQALAYSDSLDTPAMPSTAHVAVSPGGRVTGSDDGIAGAPKRATRQVNRAALVSRKAAL